MSRSSGAISAHVVDEVKCLVSRLAFHAPIRHDQSARHAVIEQGSVLVWIWRIALLWLVRAHADFDFATKKQKNDLAGLSNSNSNLSIAGWRLWKWKRATSLN